MTDTRIEAGCRADGGVTYRAHLYFQDGRWCLFVPVPGPVSDWPRHRFARRSAVPTTAARSRVLNALGFVFTDGAEWAWIEDTEVPGDDTSPVCLSAAIVVRRADGDAP
ncbi:DUF6303 family protein [Embleya sp. NPDC059237]|uniref:DUF6303 family protein n=1 Tax=Embleya sp. NPDC059237 TaxID=3346784 RepID=UPI0036A480C9